MDGYLMSNKYCINIVKFNLKPDKNPPSKPNLKYIFV